VSEIQEEKKEAGSLIGESQDDNAVLSVAFDSLLSRVVLGASVSCGYPPLPLYTLAPDGLTENNLTTETEQFGPRIENSLEQPNTIECLLKCLAIVFA
jgi:hypothetical protein